MAQYKGEVFVTLLHTASSEPQYKLGVNGGYRGWQDRTIQLGHKQLEAHYLAVHRLLWPDEMQQLQSDEQYDKAHETMIALIDEGYDTREQRILELLIEEYDDAHYTLGKEQQ